MNKGLNRLLISLLVLNSFCKGLKDKLINSQTVLRDLVRKCALSGPKKEL